MDEQGVCINFANRSCGTATYVMDPYLLEVHDELNYVWFCDICLQNRKDEI